MINRNLADAVPPMARVAVLTVYPLKSAAGIRVPFLPLDARGAVGDRRWVLVDHTGTMITARDTHRVVRIQPAFLSEDWDAGLRLAAPNLPPLEVQLHAVNRDGPVTRVRVWDDDVSAHDAGDAAAAWCSEAAGRPCRLLRLADHDRRPLAPRFAGTIDVESRVVAITDGAPLLVLGLASVDALNARLRERGHPNLMDARRFRANILLAGTDPHEEDRWRDIQIGAVALSVGSACTRCVFTTVDPDTAARGPEPLRTFAEYRRTDDGVTFGMNTTHRHVGVIEVGDPVQVVSWR